MRVRFLLGAAFLALAAPARADVPARADTPRVHNERLLVPPEAMIDAAREAEYFGHVAIGDRERAAGHVPEAAIAYARALHIHKDPVVGGRLGVLLVQAGKYGQAADLLLIALQYARTTTAERESFFRAYELARKHGAWVDVVVSEEGAAVALDGEVRNPEGYSAFSVFAVAGEHRLTAVLEGFYDATVPITVRAGEDMRVKIEMRPLFKRLERTKPRSEPAPLASTNIFGDPDYSQKEDPSYSPPQPDKPKDADESRAKHGFVFAGPVVVFGVASWMPAVGGTIGGAWRPNEYFSLGLEGRAAWLTVGIADGPISAMTAGGILSACGHLKWVFGCALGYIGAREVASSGRSFVERSDWAARLGVGGRVGARMPLSRSFSLAGTFDVLALNKRDVVSLEGTVLADQPPYMLGTQLLAGWEF